MAKALKGCVNEGCIAKQKKIYFKDSDVYCPKCGQPLFYVCKRCGMKLPDKTRKYCIRCENEMKDEHDEWGRTIMNGVSKGVSKAGKALGEGGKQAADFIGKSSKKVVEAAGDVADEIKDKTVQFVEDAKEAMDNRTFQIPDEYNKIPHIFKKDELPFPMKNVILYDMKTEESEATIIVSDVSSEYSIDFEDSQRVIDELHSNMKEQDNIGLIAVKNGTTVKNNRYVAIIKKMKAQRDVPVDQVVYILNMNVEFNGKIKFINGYFAESGCTGIRESVILNSLANEYGSMDEAFKHWSFDPYDKLIKAGFLMNVSEYEKFDKQFPEHPLSRCRELIESIIDYN